MFFINGYSNVLFIGWLISGGVAQSSMICDSLYVLLEILQINYSTTINDATVELVTVGFISVGLTSVGFISVGFISVGLTSVGLAGSSQTIGALAGFIDGFLIMKLPLEACVLEFLLLPMMLVINCINICMTIEYICC